jgi:hypothetical protein
VFGKPGSDPGWRQAVVKYRGLWDSLRNMVQVSDNSSCEALVVMVKIEVGSKANGTCLQCQSNYCDLDKNKAYVSKIHMLVHVI